MNPTHRIAFSCLIFLLAATARAEYVAYSVHDGDRRPLPENIDDIEAKYLLNVEWGDYAGRKSRVGVLEVDNPSTSSSIVVTSAMGRIVLSWRMMGSGVVDGVPGGDRRIAIGPGERAASALRESDRLPRRGWKA